MDSCFKNLQIVHKASSPTAITYSGTFLPYYPLHCHLLSFVLLINYYTLAALNLESQPFEKELLSYCSKRLTFTSEAFVYMDLNDGRKTVQ